MISDYILSLEKKNICITGAHSPKQADTRVWNGYLQLVIIINMLLLFISIFSPTELYQICQLACISSTTVPAHLKMPLTTTLRLSHLACSFQKVSIFRVHCRLSEFCSLEMGPRGKKNKTKLFLSRFPSNFHRHRTLKFSSLSVGNTRQDACPSPPTVAHLTPYLKISA